MYPLKLYLFHLPHAAMLGAATLLNVATWVWPLIQIHPEPGEQIFLHYTVLYGVDYAGDFYRLFYLPLTGLFILALNGGLSWMLFHKDKNLSYLLNAISLLCQGFLLVAVALLVFLNA